MYTVTDGTNTLTGLTVEEAAKYLLLEDGGKYDIIWDDNNDRWVLRHSTGGRWPEKTVIVSYADDIHDAADEIYAEVISNPEYFSGQVEVFTDEEFQKLENE